MIRRWPLLVLVVAFALTPAPAQQPAATPPAETAPATPAPPPVVAVSDIPKQAEDATIRLTDIQSKLKEDPAVAKIEAEQSALVEEIEKLGTTDPEGMEGLSTREVEAQQHRWIAIRDRLQRQEATLIGRAQEMERYLDEIKSGQELWQRTRESLGSEESAKALDERIEKLMKLQETVKGDASHRLAAVLTLQTSLTEQSSSVREGLASLEVAKEKIRQHLFVPERPALWTEMADPPSQLSLIDQLRESTRRNATTLRAFVRDSAVPLGAQAGLAVLLWLTMATLGRKSREWQIEDESFAGAQYALSRPLAASLFVALACTRLFHASAPPLVFEWNGILLAILLVRIVPGMVKPELRRPVYTFAGLVLLIMMDHLLMEGSVLQRLFLLVVGVAMLAAFVRWLRADGPGHVGSPGWAWILRVGSRGAAILLAISVPANVMGTVALARMLTDTVLSCFGVGIVCFLAVRVLEGVLTIGLRTNTAQLLHMVRRHRDVIQRRGTGLIRFAATLYFLYFVLFLMDMLQPVGAWLLGALQVTWTIGTLEISPSDLVAFGLAIWISVIVSRLIRFVLDEDILVRVTLPRGVPGAISMVIHYTVLTLGFVVALAAAGIELGRFAIIAGALGVGIGFGLQNLVNNFVSGLILIFERPIQVGDVIQVGTELTGSVRRIGIRSSTVRTWQGAEVIVPNGNLVSNEVVNWTLSDRQRRIELPVGVAYGTDPKRVLELLTGVAGKSDDVLTRPEAPYALFQGFGDSSLDFELRYWTASADWLQLKSEIAVAVHDAIREAGIEIPFPQRDLHLRSVDEDAGRGLSGSPRPGGGTKDDKS